jgi:hypothetical protein
LPNLHERSVVIQALLRTVSRLAENFTAAARGGDGEQPQRHAFLPPSAAVLEPPAGASPGAFCGLRLLPGEALEGELRALHLRLAGQVMDDPPYDLRWLKEHAMKVCTACKHG